MPNRPAPTRPGPTRRRLLAAAALAAIPAPGRAMLPGAATMLVPGPEDGPLARLALRLGAALGRSATTAITVQAAVLGGPDGVTAANRFATEAAPDGRTLLVVPGAANQARLVGDPRARFENGGWLPVCALQGSALVAGRQALAMAGAAGPVRFGFAGPDSVGAGALLGLDLLGLGVQPLPGFPPGKAEAALLQGQLDAIVLQGADVPARLAALGLRPWFLLDGPGTRDPALPDTPPLPELLGGEPAELRAAFLSVAANARLYAGLVLPALTPANLVALWRGAAARWLEEEGKASAAAAALRPMTGPEAAALLAALGSEPALTYREWLQRRLGWRAD